MPAERLRDLEADAAQTRRERLQVHALLEGIRAEAARVLAADREAEAQAQALGQHDDNARRGGREVIDPSLLWFVHGKAYDLRPFLRLHPGAWALAAAVHSHRGVKTVCGWAACVLAWGVVSLGRATGGRAG